MILQRTGNPQRSRKVQLGCIVTPKCGRLVSVAKLESCLPDERITLRVVFLRQLPSEALQLADRGDVVWIHG